MQSIVIKHAWQANDPSLHTVTMSKKEKKKDNQWQRVRRDEKGKQIMLIEFPQTNNYCVRNISAGDRPVKLQNDRLQIKLEWMQRPTAVLLKQLSFLADILGGKCSWR